MSKLKIEIELSDAQKAEIERCLECINRCIKDGTFEPLQPGLISLESLTAILLSDVAYTMSRPGSWEGSNMISVLRSHGYDIWR